MDLTAARRSFVIHRLSADWTQTNLGHNSQTKPPQAHGDMQGSMRSVVSSRMLIALCVVSKASSRYARNFFGMGTLRRTAASHLHTVFSVFVLASQAHRLMRGARTTLASTLAEQSCSTQNHSHAPSRSPDAVEYASSKGGLAQQSKSVSRSATCLLRVRAARLSTATESQPWRPDVIEQRRHVMCSWLSPATTRHARSRHE